MCAIYFRCKIFSMFYYLKQGFFKENVRNLLWICRDPIFSDFRDPMIIFADSRDPIRVPRKPCLK